MSHRTQDLEQLSGLPHIIRELRYNEVARQSLAVVLVVVYAWTGQTAPLFAAVGLTVAMLGVLMRLYASGYIMKNKELAQSGPYAWVRHPLYTGNILLVVGFAVANRGLWAVPLAIAFFWFYYPPAIEYEDRKLKRIFGEVWRDWATRTPALLPRFSNPKPAEPGSWSLAKSLRKNGELLFAIFAIACGYWIVAPLLSS